MFSLSTTSYRSYQGLYRRRFLVNVLLAAVLIVSLLNAELTTGSSTDREFSEPKKNPTNTAVSDRLDARGPSKQRHLYEIESETADNPNREKSETAVSFLQKSPANEFNKQATDASETRNITLIDRIRRSTTYAEGNGELQAEGEDDYDVISSAAVDKRRQRWSSRNVQLQGKRSSTFDDDVTEDDNDGTNEQMQIDASSEKEKKTDKIYNKIWGKLIPPHAAISRKLHAPYLVANNDVSDDIFRYTARRTPIAGVRELNGAEGAAAQPSRKGRYPATMESEVESNEFNSASLGGIRQKVIPLEEQTVKRNSDGRQSLLGDLLLKRLAGKDIVSWNGSQKGWAGNNVRIWG